MQVGLYIIQVDLKGVMKLFISRLSVASPPFFLMELYFEVVVIFVVFVILNTECVIALSGQWRFQVKKIDLILSILASQEMDFSSCLIYFSKLFNFVL